MVTRICTLTSGNPGKAKAVGEGVSEMKIDFGPGHRVYFVQKGAALVIVLDARSNSVGNRRRVHPRPLDPDPIAVGLDRRFGGRPPPQRTRARVLQ